jgi:hypothetical protein
MPEASALPIYLKSNNMGTDTMNTQIKLSPEQQRALNIMEAYSDSEIKAFYNNLQEQATE